MLKDTVTATFENIAARIPLSTPESTEFNGRIKNFLKSSSQTMLISVPLSIINTNENIREVDTNTSEFQSLVESIKKTGILQPPLLTIKDESGELDFVCVAGHRRLAAAKELNLEKTTCLIRKFQDKHYQMISTVIENTHRKNLHPFELAEGIRRLVNEGYSFEELENLFDRNQWNLRRFNKMNDWTPLSRNLVKEHSERFTPTWLLHLAAKAFTPQEVENEIKAKLGLSDVKNERKKKNSYQEKINKFFDNRSLTEEQKNLIQEFMKTVGLISETKNQNKLI